MTRQITGVFFRSSYDVHRDLHSFPTRRSSDLKISDMTGCVPWDKKHLSPLFTDDDLVPLVDPVRQSRNSRLIGFVDRKSTRLNSSHSQISYAVSCLKKKKIDGEEAQAAQDIDS